MLGLIYLLNRFKDESIDENEKNVRNHTANTLEINEWYFQEDTKWKINNPKQKNTKIKKKN